MTNTGPKPGSPSDDGYFEFCVPPGQYYVEVVMPPQGLVRARPNIGNNEEIDSDLTNANGKSTTDTFILTSGQNKTDIGAGFYPMATAGNLVWVDENLNGIQEVAEPRMAGVLVEAFNADTNQKINEAETNANGIYMLDYLEKGNIYMRFTPPAGYGATFPGMTVDGADSDVDHTYGPYTTRSFYFQPGLTNNNIDMGLAFGILPVDWLDVYAHKKDDVHVISWKTANEVNLSHYEVERRVKDGKITVLGQKVNPVTNPDNIRSYTVEDSEINENGIYYYRIKQVDFDGKFAYSDWVSVHQNYIPYFNMFPNPASTEVNIEVETISDASIVIELLDGFMKVVQTIVSENTGREGRNKYKVDISHLPSGVYNVKYNIGGDIYYRKLIHLH
jgi:5-hydroxyisourate hydrolase-like protein (transthyretin family)